MSNLKCDPDCGPAAPMTGANSVLVLARQVLAEARTAADHSESRLGPVLLSDFPVADSTADQYQAAPLFSELIALLDETRAVLRFIHHTIDRVDL